MSGRSNSDIITILTGCGASVNLQTGKHSLPFLTSGFFHLYHLVGSICSFYVGLVNVFIFITFCVEIPVSKQC